MDSKISKEKTLQWAITVLKNAVEQNTYGRITFSMQNGIIGDAKQEKTIKPLVDITKEKQ